MATCQTHSAETWYAAAHPPADEAFKPQLRPYAFVKFDTFIQRTKRLYQDSRCETAYPRPAYAWQD